MQWMTSLWNHIGLEEETDTSDQVKDKWKIIKKACYQTSKDTLGTKTRQRKDWTSAVTWERKGSTLLTVTNGVTVFAFRTSSYTFPLMWLTYILSLACLL